MNSSAVELNVGLICSCLPVVFVVIKGVYTGGSLTAFIQYMYFRTRGKRSGASNSGQPAVSSGSSGGDQMLPQIPKGPMTGIQTFIRRAGRPQQSLGTNITVMTEMSMYTDLSSTDDAYHEQLKRAHIQNYHTNHSNPSRVQGTDNDPSFVYNHPQGHESPCYYASSQAHRTPQDSGSALSGQARAWNS